MNVLPANQSWARPVRFSLGTGSDGAVISSATGEEILRLTHEQFCDTLRDLQLDPALESVLRRSIPVKP